MKRYLKQHKALIALFAFFVFASEGILLYLARLNGQLVDLASKGAGTGNTGAGSMGTGMVSALFPLFGLLVVLSILMPICFYLYTLFIQFFRAKIQAAMRKDLFRSILGRTYRAYLQRDEGEYLAAYTTQIGSLEDSYFRAIFGILQIIASVVFGLFFLYLIHPPFVLYSVIGILPALVVPRLIEPLINRLQKEKIAAVSRNLATLNEYLSGLHTIFLYQRRKVFQKLFSAQTDEISNISARIPQYMNLTTNLSHLLLQLYYVVIVLVTSIEIAKGNISVGSYVAAIHILSDVTGGLGFTAHYLQQFAISKKTIEHIFDVANMETEIDATKVAAVASDTGSLGNTEPKTEERRALTAPVQSIEYRDVHFSYDGTTDIINGFDRIFTEKGIYQVVGASGSGKSTLLSLLCGYLAPRSGQTKINDTSVVQIANLNDLFTIMRQEAIYFDGSLKDNITMFADIPDSKILAAFDQMGLTKIAPKLHDTEFNLSGGEQRRTMLIRALLRDTPILILDEPLANLDKESIALVEAVLKQIQDKFVFVITHEPLSIPVVDTIRI